MSENPNETIYNHKSWDSMIEVVRLCMKVADDLREIHWSLSLSKAIQSLEIGKVNDEVVKFINWYYNNAESNPYLLGSRPMDNIFYDLDLNENCLYSCYVKTTESNVEHKSFLFTGFKTGAYCYVYNNSYEIHTDFRKCYSIRNIKFLSTIK